MGHEMNSKIRHILLFDGTWRSARSHTNVSETMRYLKEEDTSCRQVVKYYKGVGSRLSGSGNVAEGAFGIGVDVDLFDAYIYIAQNWKPGDEIFMFGFSRGAFIARSLVGMIAAVGLVKSDVFGEAWRAYRDRRHMPGPRPLIKFMGLYDTVGSMGVPFFSFDDKNYRFHDTNLSPIVQNAYHAISMDETCPDFKPCYWTNNPKDSYVEQRMFPGSHGDIGGSYKDRTMADYVLEWMLSKSEGAGLELKGMDGLRKRIYIDRIKLHDGYWDFCYGIYGMAYLGSRYHRGLQDIPGLVIDESANLVKPPLNRAKPGLGEMKYLFDWI